MRARVGVATALLGATLAVGAAAAAAAPAPGSAAQVKALVGAAHKIKRLPSDLTPSVLDAPDDNAAAAYPIVRDGCATVTQCVFGDTASDETMVLFGDSHAEMWLSSIIPYAVSQKLRLVVLSTLACPVADVDVWLSASQGYYTACTSDRAKDVAAIVAMKPVDVVIAERTAHLKSAPTSYFTNAQWQQGLETTLSQLKPSGARTVVIGDNPVLVSSPPQCLAAYPTDVQRCSTANPNRIKSDLSHETAEKAAAAAEGDTFIDPVPWLCTKTCSAVIGTMVVYWDAYHVTNTYATYLSKVMGKALAGALKA